MEDLVPEESDSFEDEIGNGIVCGCSASAKGCERFYEVQLIRRTSYQSIRSIKYEIRRRGQNYSGMDC